MTRSIQQSITLACALFLAACAASPPASTASPQAAAAVVMPDVAGTWNARTLSMTGDSVLTTYQIKATNDRSGWTLTFPGRDPIEIRVLEVSGDSIVGDAGPYASALRPGVTVSTRFVMRFQGDRMVGNITADYQMPESKVTVPLRMDGIRAR